MSKYHLLCFALLAHLIGFAQVVDPGLPGASEPPKLVVGIIVDQMPYEFLRKFQEHYSDDGFKRLIREGFVFENAQYPYIPTYTAPGHSSVYTGTTPSVHGIIGNSWYERETTSVVSNVGDATVRIIGPVVENSYGLSPKRLNTSTITDELKRVVGSTGKVISVSLKDRGAILPGGQLADAAYWHDVETSPGYFITSSHYMEELPEWVQSFNSEGRSMRYMEESWEPLLPLSVYNESAPDDNPHEVILRGKEAPVFPYDLAAMRKKYKDDEPYLNLLWVTPFGNTLVRDFALRALEAEQLGKDAVTDFLCISFSSPDVAGHTFGPQSVEVQDIYLRLDRDIAMLLNTLDQEVGRDNYILFLSSDHGVTPVVSYAAKQGQPAGLAVIPRYNQSLNFELALKYGAFNWIENFGLEQIYLNHNLVTERGESLEEMQASVAELMLKQPGVRFALTATDLKNQLYDSGLEGMVQNGYFEDRSGDVMLVYEPGFVPTMDFRTPVSKVRGASHGSGYEPDTHVPLVWLGKGIQNGSSQREVHITQIAPTLSRLLNIPVPGGSKGELLQELFD